LLAKREKSVSQVIHQEGEKTITTDKLLDPRCWLRERERQPPRGGKGDYNSENSIVPRSRKI